MTADRRGAAPPLPVPVEAPWPAPRRVRAITTTRSGGVSDGVYGSLNLSARSGDDPRAVAENRRRLRTVLGLAREPTWLRQEHGNHVVDAGAARGEPIADASFIVAPGPICAVLTADCLPVFVCDASATRVGLAHAGWRGLAAGVLESLVRRLDGPGRGGSLMACLGPGIGRRAYEVGDEVRDALLRADPGALDAFAPSPAGRWLANLCEIARRRLRRAGVEFVFGGEACTHADPSRFFSHRRDGNTGRMASLIWLLPE